MKKRLLIVLLVIITILLISGAIILLIQADQCYKLEVNTQIAQFGFHCKDIILLADNSIKEAKCVIFGTFCALLSPLLFALDIWVICE